MGDIPFRRCWNAGLDEAEAACRLVARGAFADQDQALMAVAERYAVFARHLGIAPFPARCLYDERAFSDAAGVAAKRGDRSRMPSGYLEWRGDVGPGAVLREAIARERRSSADGPVDGAAPPAARF